MMNSQSNENVNRTPIEAKAPVIKVVGLGGGGCNAVNRMIEHGMSGVEFIACNTDVQALESSLADVKVQLGPKCTRGLGAGSLPSVGEKAAEESFQALADALEGADMVFLTAGMGGGTGTGSIPVAARVSKHLGAVTIAVVTTPFSFEMTKRQKNAVIGLQKLRQFTHTLITVPNDRLLEVAPEDLTLEMAFKMADDVLRQGVQGISELLTETGLINVDFAHIRHVMELGGGALMSIGTGEGEGKALKALDQALNHPLLEKVDLSTATGVIANFTGGPDLTFAEVAETLNHLHEEAGNAAEIIPGVINDPNLTDRTQVILIVTGLGGLPLEKAVPGAEKYLADLPINDSIPQAEPASSYFQMPKEQYREPAYAFTPGQAHVNPNDLDVPAFLRKRMRG
ncbi:MAG: cell division protein FtsZ [Anaerolineaceae bacterium]|nr:cell division protein FtsZ [Anaerolineaceae bacterium]